MDKHVSRNKDKYNPYTLEVNIEKSIYICKFKDSKNILQEIKAVWFRRPNKSIDDFYNPINSQKSFFKDGFINKWMKYHFGIFKELKRM